MLTPAALKPVNVNNIICESFMKEILSLLNRDDRLVLGCGYLGVKVKNGEVLNPSPQQK